MCVLLCIQIAVVPPPSHAPPGFPMLNNYVTSLTTPPEQTEFDDDDEDAPLPPPAPEVVPLGVEAQVDRLIREAMDPARLASLYIGWYGGDGWVGGWVIGGCVGRVFSRCSRVVERMYVCMYVCMNRVVSVFAYGFSCF